MTDSLTITLSGDSIGLSDLTEALADFSTVLEEVEREVTGRRAIEWKVIALERSSATVRVTPVQPQADLFDQRSTVIAACVGGLERLVESADRPPHFSDRALRSAKNLAWRSRGEVSAVELVGALENQPTRRVPLGAPIIAHVDEIMGVSGRASGAIEGRLETITIHDQHAFTIYDPLRRRGTRCVCDAQVLEESRPLLGRRVLVYGDIGYNRAGDPNTIRVRRFEALRTRDVLPQPEDVRGVYGDSPVSGTEHVDYLRRH